MTNHILEAAIKDYPILAQQQVHLAMNGTTAMLLLLYLQIAAGLPERAEKWADPRNPLLVLAAQLQARVSVTPALGAMAAAGWKRRTASLRNSAPGAGESERNAKDASVNASVDASITPA